MLAAVVVVWGVLATLTVSAAAELYDSSLLESVLDSELCEQHLTELSSFTLYDASFRMPQSLMEGNFISWGNYHQCLKLGRESPVESEARVPRGKHCVLMMDSLSLPLPVLPELSQLPWRVFNELSQKPWHEINATWTQERILRYRQMKNGFRILAGRHDERSMVTLTLPAMQLGVCIPETCTPRQALAPYLHNALVDAQYVEQCRIPGDRPYVAADYVSLAVFSFVGLLTVFSTGYELYHRFIKKDEKRAGSAWSICSIYRNGQQVLAVGERGKGVILCLDGIRAMSILWVILGHSLIKLALANFYNWLDALDWFDSERALYINSANISVDTFFMLSGLLIVYTTAHKMSQKVLVSSLHLYYLNRLLRMFPLLATAVLLQAGPLHRVSDGPNWAVESSQVQFCRDNWWAALLHIQNYYAPREECLPHTWYLSVDVQLHIISPLVLFWLLGSRRMARVGAISAALISLTASAIFCFVTNMVTTSFADIEGEGLYYYKWFYANTLTRAPVFFIGMAYGYLLHEYRKTRLELPKWAVCVLWTAAAALGAGVLYLFYLTEPTSAESQLVANITNSFQRPAWALALGWLIVACVHGYGGPINWFLSLPMWQFISRISYAMYIFHYPMQWAAGASVFAPMYFSPGRLWIHFVSDVAVTMLVSVFFLIVIDMPFSTLVRKALTAISRRPPKPRPRIEEEVVQKEADIVVDFPRPDDKQNTKKENFTEKSEL